MKRIASAAAMLLAIFAAACSCEEEGDGSSAVLLSPPKSPREAPIPNTLEQARNLARQSEAPERGALRRLLTAEPTAASWAAFGLGSHCGPSDALDTDLLATALASWVSGEDPVDAQKLHTAAWAIGRCGEERAEAVLRSFLSANPDEALDPLVLASATGLGALADRRGHLSERTQTALLDAAEREKSPYLLYPLSRLRRLNGAVGARLLDVAGDLVTGPAGPHRRHAIFALGSSGPEAALPLGQVVVSDGFSGSERAAAAQALARLASEGQKHLDESVSKLLSAGLPGAATDPGWVPIRAALESLELVDVSHAALVRMSRAPVLEGDEPGDKAQRRRVLWLRCRAADLLAGDDPNEQRLLDCAPEDHPERARARLRVLDRSRLKGNSAALLGELFDTQSAELRTTIIRLLPGHPELDGVTDLLLEALRDDSVGVQAAASQVLAAYPGRVQGPDNAPDTRVVEALEELLATSDKLPPETAAAAVSAAGALGALTLKPLVEQVCDGPRSALHGPAQRALALLGSPKRVCPARDDTDKAQKRNPGQAHQGPTPTDPRSKLPPHAPLLIEVDSDIGRLEIHLDDPSSPESRAHVAAMIQRGDYDGLAIHGASPGFAVQFGDSDGDGYEDRVPPGLPNEVSPAPFGPFSIGMSAFAPGTQDSQLFVTVADAPQLRGRRVRLGRVEGPWHLLVPGDKLHDLRLVDQTKPAH